MRRNKAFTLVELLVVIGIIAILAALLFPAIQGALTKAKMVKVMNNGRSIMQSLMGKQLEKDAASLPSIYPASTINPKNLEKTCGACHPKAGKGFASVKFHQTVSATGARGAWFVRLFYIGFIAVLVLGFVLHIGAEMYARAKGRKVIR